MLVAPSRFLFLCFMYGFCCESIQNGVNGTQWHDGYNEMYLRLLLTICHSIFQGQANVDMIRSFKIDVAELYGAICYCVLLAFLFAHKQNVKICFLFKLSIFFTPELICRYNWYGVSLSDFVIQQHLTTWKLIPFPDICEMGNVSCENVSKKNELQWSMKTFQSLE